MGRIITIKNTGLSEADLKICKRFHLTKRESGLSYEQLAVVLKTNVPYLKAVAQGKFVCNFTVMRLWKRKFGKSYDWIIDGSRGH